MVIISVHSLPPTHTQQCPKNQREETKKQEDVNS